MNTLVAPEHALKALRALEDSGHEAWLVGGFVRDSILGRPVYDVDIACNAPWTQSKAAFESAGFTVHETGTAHGTITAIVDENPIEVTSFRTESRYSDGRHPDSVSLAETIEEDLARRDFTINAIAYHPERGFRDPYNGLADIKDGIIRTVGNPNDRFEEDHLRILRGCRFCSELGFTIEEQCLWSMTFEKSLMLSLPAERVSRELERFLLGDHVCDALLTTVDVISAVLPELVAMKGFDQRSHYHSYDVLEHTAHAVQGTKPEPLNRWAALFHDIGKPATFYMAKGSGHFYGHALESVLIARGALSRLKLPRKLQDDVLTLVEMHDDIIGPTPRIVKHVLHRFDGDIELFRALCDLKKADALAHAQCCTDRSEMADELLQVLDQVLEEGQPYQLSDLVITGSDVIDVCGITPGPLVGDLLDKTLSAVIDKRVENEREALLDYVRDLAK